MIEAGHRCAIPTCRAVAPLQIDHIEDWAMVREHKFENMIVLCANCHGLKNEGPRRLDRKALRQYKDNLSTINDRNGDLERRLLSMCEIPVDLIVQSLSGVKSRIFTQKGSDIRGYFEHPRDKVNLFEMFFDPVTEKVGISFNVSYCINHGSWAVRRRHPFP